MKPPSRRRRVMNVLLLLLALYTALCLAVMFMQRSMLYHPMRGKESALVELARRERFDPWRNATGEVIGWQRLHRTPPARGQVLIVHGNAGFALHRAGYADALQQAAPLDVFLLEYPGYGSRPGSPTQASLCAAAEEAFSLLPRTLPLFLVGESLGTGVACHLAATHPDAFAGLLLVAPYNNLGSVAQSHLPILPARWLLRDRFPSDRWLAMFRGPVAFLLADQDTVVPARFGQRLHDGYTGPRKLWRVPDAEHNDLHDQPPAWWQDVVAFWDSTSPPR